MPSTIKPGHAVLTLALGLAVGYYIGKKKK